MRRILPYFDELWSKDLALTTLLVFLVIYLFFLYPFWQAGSVKFVTVTFFSVILITGAITASRNRIFRTLALSWGLLTFIFLWVRYLFPHRTLILAATYLALFYLLLLTFLILAQSLREGTTTSHRIMGAVAAYLLVGMIWSLVYYVIALQIPGAFEGLGSVMEGHPEAIRAYFQYFSFTVLTTVGFGDIVPIHPVARMAAILEGVTGQLFPAILIARLVSLQVQSKQRT